MSCCARSDYVSINCPLTKESRGMIGAREFALMQPHAYFITTARGFIHDEAALLEALRNKRIAGAGLDVWAKEPPPPDHPLLQFDNVLASPHTAGVTKEARANMGRIAAEQMLDALDGKRPPRIINPEVWPLTPSASSALSGSRRNRDQAAQERHSGGNRIPDRRVAQAKALRHRLVGDAAAVNVQARPQMGVLRHGCKTLVRDRQAERQCRVVQRLA